MAQLNVRIDDDSKDMLDALARARGVNISDLLRDLVRQALGRDERPRDDTTPASLSALDRRTLALQHETLALVTAEDPDESAYHRQMVEVLNYGYTSEYYRTFLMIQPELSGRECNLVRDIFDMFRIVEYSYAELSESERASLGEHADHALMFRGFDFSDALEGRLASYAEFLIKDERWSELADRFDDRHERGNSHIPVLASYQRMLSAYQPIWSAKVKALGGPRDYLFSAEELQQVLAAWPYPRAGVSSRDW